MTFTDETPTVFGAHLLGRVPSENDPRNYQLSTYLEKATPTKLDVALDAFMKHWYSKDLKNLIGLIVQNLDQINGVTPTPTPVPTPTPTPTPTPVPTPTPGVQEWLDHHQLDQGNTGHCCGFGGDQYLNTLGSENVDDKLTDADAHKLYYDLKIQDGEPGAENGSSVHTVAIVLKKHGRINAYAWADSLDTIKTWVLTKGPLVVGTDWENAMFSPDANGVVHRGGGLAGGHCYIIVGYDSVLNRFKFQNSWGPSFGANGYFYMDAEEWWALYQSNGEACAAVELPL